MSINTTISIRTIANGYIVHASKYSNDTYIEQYDNYSPPVNQEYYAADTAGVAAIVQAVLAE